VLAKADLGVAAHYERRLVTEELKPLGAALRDELEKTSRLLLEVTGDRVLLERNPVLRRSIDVRNPYVDPINLIQAEMLRRLRECEARGATCDPLLLETLLVSFNGVAAGMRNTG
jgi:phosphoenolpyruvate carboxylase